MRDLIEKAVRRFSIELRKILFSPRSWLRNHVDGIPTIRLGTKYGGWHFIHSHSLENGNAILCGVGEDISFDLALQREFKCQIVLVDPTPKAIKHVEHVLEAAKNNRRANVNNCDDQFYQFDGVDFGKLTFIPVAIWKDKSQVTFWEPYNPTHVSHSITNYQQTSSHISVAADTLAGICDRAGIDSAQIDLLKLDIEGAEYEVVKWICTNKIRPKQILIEFDELNFPNRNTKKHVKKSVNLLKSIGYKLVCFDGQANCTFVPTV